MPAHEMHIRIDEDLKQRLLILAKKERRSLASMVAFAALAYADQHEPKQVAEASR
jgi:predicted transcriptional regulator